MDEPCHRLVVGMCEDSYIPPHRHLDPHKSESLLVLQGRLGLLTFSEEGQVLLRRELSQRAGCRASISPPGTTMRWLPWRGDCLFFECKAGPSCLWARVSDQAGHRWRRRRCRALSPLDARSIRLNF